MVRCLTLVREIMNRNSYQCSVHNTQVKEYIADLQNILVSLSLTRLSSTLNQNLERTNQHFGMQRTLTSNWQAPVSFNSDS